jgi:hypothetical protein
MVALNDAGGGVGSSSQYQIHSPSPTSPVCRSSHTLGQDWFHKSFTDLHSKALEQPDCTSKEEYLKFPNLLKQARSQIEALHNSNDELEDRLNRGYIPWEVALVQIRDRLAEKSLTK